MIARCRVWLIVLGTQVFACGARTTLQDAPEPICGPGPACAAPLVCCDSACVDPSSDVAHCGACDAACAPYPHAEPACAGGECAMGPCDPGFVDCNASPADGCEIAAPTAACECIPGESVPCYDGPRGTEGVAACKGGVRTCEATATWGACTGQSLPAAESCNGLDDDCDGQVDFVDADGDGWTPCDGDCCDTTADCAIDPHGVNPGAYDVPGNGVDDDCDPKTDDTGPIACDPVPLEAPTSSDELVRAIDLCQVTTEDAPLPARRWGVLASALRFADGSDGPPLDVQAGVLQQYGPLVVARKGATMAALSSGTARAEGDPGFIHPQNGNPLQKGNLNAQTSSAVPSKWLDGNGGTQPPPVDCEPCAGIWCTQANDPIELHVRIRVPTNAASFSFWHRFYTAEYPEFECIPGSDRFVALLTTGVPACTPNGPARCVPPDTNIAFDTLGNPISANDAWFEVCEPKPDAPPGTCPLGHFELEETGMGGWAGDISDGAATSWIQAEAPVVPGEAMELDFVIWDGFDHNVDSLVLVDGFEWHQR